MDAPGVSLKQSSPSSMRGPYGLPGEPKTIEIDMTSRYEGGVFHPQGLMMTKDTDTTAWVAADRTRVGTQQDAGNCRVLAHDVKDPSGGHVSAGAYEAVTWQSSRSLYCNNKGGAGRYGLFTQAQENLFNQRILVWKSDES